MIAKLFRAVCIFLAVVLAVAAVYMYHYSGSVMKNTYALRNNRLIFTLLCCAVNAGMLLML